MVQGPKSPYAHSPHPLHCTPNWERNGGYNLGRVKVQPKPKLGQSSARSGVGLCFQIQPLATGTKTPESPPPQTPVGQHGTRRLGAHSGWVGAGRPSPHSGPELKKAPSAGLTGEDRQSPGDSRVQPHLPGRPPCLPLHTAPEFGSAGSRPRPPKLAGGLSRQSPRRPRGRPPPGKGVPGPSGNAGSSRRPERTLTRAGPRQ